MTGVIVFYEFFVCVFDTFCLRQSLRLFGYLSPSNCLFAVAPSTVCIHTVSSQCLQLLPLLVRLFVWRDLYLVYLIAFPVATAAALAGDSSQRDIMRTVRG
ncbi:unnamed protein product, partial [Ectocarpus sp. 4 AP-2014]